MEQVDIHLKNNNLNGAISECIRNNFINFGYLLSEINFNSNFSKNDSNLLVFLESYSYLKRAVNNIKYDNNTIIEKDNNIIEKEIKIRLECNWLNSKELCDLWNKMSMGNYKWNNLKITWEDEYDYLVIINSCNLEEDKIIENKTILIRMEPYMICNKNLWGKWSNPNFINYLDVLSYERNFNNIEWHISKTYNQLLNENIIKTKNNEISTILSSKYKDPGQIRRIDFAKFLDNKQDIILDVYGENKINYKNYKGNLPYHKKDEGLLPYKYTFNCENFEIPGYFTEKIIDAILSETLIFYHGCLDIFSYIDKRAFVWLELSNFEDDYEYIKKCINENLWEQRLPYIKEAKLKILNELQFFPRLEKIIKKS